MDQFDVRSVGESVPVPPLKGGTNGTDHITICSGVREQMRNRWEQMPPPRLMDLFSTLEQVGEKQAIFTAQELVHFFDLFRPFGYRSGERSAQRLRPWRGARAGVAGRPRTGLVVQPKNAIFLSKTAKSGLRLSPFLSCRSWTTFGDFGLNYSTFSNLTKKGAHHA